MAGVFIVVILMVLGGCYVNRAVVDPWSYAPGSPCSYWAPAPKAEALACEVSSLCPEIPPPNALLTLAEVLDITLINNPQTQRSWAESRQAAAEYGLSQGSAFPLIEGQFFHEKEKIPEFISNQDPGMTQNALFIFEQTDWGPQLNLTWTLFDFGQRRYSSEAARYALYFANFMHNQTLQDVVEAVTLDYYDYLFQKKLLESYEADLADAEETLAAAELGLRCGIKNVSDVLQSRTQALLAEIQLSQQKKVVSISYATLLEDMGLPSNCDVQFQKLPFIDPEEAHLECVDNFIQTAMQCRPDLLASRSNVSAAQMHLKSVKRSWTPVLDYSLDIGRTYFPGGLHDNYDYISTFTLSMPIFTGFQIRNSIKLAEAELAEAESDLKQSELSVIKDVTTAHFNIAVAFHTLKAALQLLKCATEQYDVAIRQYRAGVNGILDVVSAQSALFDARAKEAEACREWFTSLATLTYSTGMISMNLKDPP